MYSCHLLFITSASVSSIPFLSFIEPIFAWNVPLVSLIFLKTSLVFTILLFSSICLHWSLRINWYQGELLLLRMKTNTHGGLLMYRHFSVCWHSVSQRVLQKPHVVSMTVILTEHTEARRGWGTQGNPARLGMTDFRLSQSTSRAWGSTCRIILSTDTALENILKGFSFSVPYSKSMWGSSRWPTHSESHSMNVFPSSQFTKPPLLNSFLSNCPASFGPSRSFYWV